MSCGKPHATPCAEVMDHLYELIDNELPPRDVGRLKEHLDECGPCLKEYGLEEAVKALVKRSCREPAPEELRARVLVRIQEVRVEIHEVQQP
ncbi:mycothiol system anti-sigma-R factor [Vallicoccus soli]|uniref:Mycothiol system anti-sigma-R factor n=1 Tax=Vallicoccus soli TaxID=2339232 RepID=A0A3A3Z3X6_9ACTN|nr:mycothiol system anti-sigma-R factor [Vallicoccus soli]RJK98114.1 mycothiol system anti-sigma-R factor [Vallicoccus soli]